MYLQATVFLYVYRLVGLNVMGVCNIMLRVSKSETGIYNIAPLHLHLLLLIVLEVQFFAKTIPKCIFYNSPTN